MEHISFRRNGKEFEPTKAELKMVLDDHAHRLAIAEKALELAITDICVGRECNVCPYDNICDSWQGLHKEKAKDYFINKAKEMINEI